MSILIPLLLTLAAAPAQGNVDRDRLRAISTRMQAFVDAGVLSGVVLRVERHGRLVYEDAIGYADIDTRTPMRSDTIFQIMSMTKPVTAIAVMKCAEEGRLLLDDPVEKYLPGLKEPKLVDGTAANRKPTIRHLLTHTGGFGGNDPKGLDDDSKRMLTLREFTDKLQDEPLSGQPGAEIKYSGPGYAALGRIVEITSGTTLEQFAEERIFRPLAMKDTFFFAPTSVYPRIATMYDHVNGRLTKLEPDPFRRGAKYANPAGGLYSTASDMAKLLSSLGKVLSPASIEAMTTCQTGNLTMDGSEALGYGLGFTVVRGPQGQASLKPVGSYGHTGAFGTEFWGDRKNGLVVAYMAQTWESEPRKVFNTMVNAAISSGR